MVFCSFTFLLFFLPAVLLGHRMLPEKARRPFLLAASLFFYAWGSPAWLLLLLYVMALDWGGALLLSRAGRGRKALLAALIALNLLPLAYFKYAGFLRDTLAAATGLRLTFEDPLLPAGPSQGVMGTRMQFPGTPRYREADESAWMPLSGRVSSAGMGRRASRMRPSRETCLHR